MGVDFGRLHIGMAQQFLDGANIRSAFEQVCGEAVPERMCLYVFQDSRRLCSPSDSSLHGVGIDVVTADDARLARIFGAISRGKDELPTPGGCRVRIFLLERERQADRAATGLQVRFVLSWQPDVQVIRPAALRTRVMEKMRAGLERLAR